MSLPSLSQAVSVLTPNSNTDGSVGLLNNLFGPGWHSYLYHAANGGGSALFSLLTAFNSVVMAGVVVMAAYVYGVGIVGTAHEGKPLGERYHTVWTPLRTAGSLFMLAPLPGVGISVIQGIVLLFAWFSIGGANFVTKAATDYMAQHAGALTFSQPSYSANNLAVTILQSEVTQQYLATFENANFSNPSVFTSGSPDWQGNINKTLKVNQASKIYGSYVFTFSTPSGLQPGSLGHISVPCELDKVGKTLCDARLKAIETMAMTLHPMAVAVVASTLPSKNVVAGTATTINTSVFNDAVDSYQQMIADAATKQLSLTNPGYATNLKNALDNLNRMGWAALGAYYWTINNANQTGQRQIDSHPSMGGFDTSLVGQMISDPSRYTGMMQGLASKLGFSGEQLKSNSSSGTLGSALTKFIHLPQPPSLNTSSTQGAGSNFVTNGQAAGWIAHFWSWTFGLDGGDPIARLQSIGNGMFNTVEIGYGSWLAAKMLAAGGEGASQNISWVPGLGAITGAAAKSAVALVNGITPALMFFLTAFGTLAFVWAYYLPSVPFILWISAVFGWVIQLVDMLIGVILWAAVIGLPHGEGIFGQRGEQGVLMLLSTLFRPTLMVVGFFASFLVVDAAMKFLGSLFIMAVTGMQVGHTSGLIAFASIGVIASILVVTLIHKVFGLISFLPDFAFNWTGHHAQGMGEGGDEQNVRGGFVAAIGRGHSAGSGAVAFKQRQDNLRENQRENEQLAAGAQRGFDPSDSGSAAPPPSGKPGG